MASGKWHFIVGGIIALVALWFLNVTADMDFWTFPIVLVIVYIYTRLPDVDHKNAKITKEMFISGLILCAISVFKIFPNTFWYGLSIMLVTVALMKTKHRGPTHTIWFCIGTPFLLLLISGLPNQYIMILIAFISCYTHLLLDGYLFKITLKAKKGMW